MELSLLSSAYTTGRELVEDQNIRVEIYRQGAWQELPFHFLVKGDRFRPINGSGAGVILLCVEDAAEQAKPPRWYVSAKPEVS